MLRSSPQSVVRQETEYCRIEDGTVIDKHVVRGVGHNNWLGYWSEVSHCRRHCRKILGAVLPTASIERSLGLADGAFANRPHAWLSFRLLDIKWKVDHRTGVGTIYLASIAVWLFLLLTSMSAPLVSAWAPQASVRAPLAAFGLAVIATWCARTWIMYKKKQVNDEMRFWAAKAVQKAALNQFVASCGRQGADRLVLQARARGARNHRRTGTVLCRNQARLLAVRLKGTGCMSSGGATHGFATAVAVRLRHKPKRIHAKAKSRIVPALR